MRSFAPARLRAVAARWNSAVASFFTTEILTMGKMIDLTASDGHKLSAYRADPSGKPRGGIVVIQEIFGVNSHIKAVTDGFAADGYLAIAPSMFDRVQKNVDLGYSPDDIAKGREIRGKVTNDMAVKDAERRNSGRGQRRQGRHRRLLLGRPRHLAVGRENRRASSARCPTTAAASSTTPSSRRRCR